MIPLMVMLLVIDFPFLICGEGDKIAAKRKKIVRDPFYFLHGPYNREDPKND